ncbi:MAG: efflux RND transporter periplasmic adaptor subunit [Anaerolineaceae bacterium]|jgi:multidrug resistance efflux pump
MHLDPRRIFPVFLIVILGLAAGAYYVEQNAAGSRSFIYSGTIEATLIHLSSSVGGTVENVYVKEGNPVKAGGVLMDLYSGAKSNQVTSSNEKIVSPINGVVLEVLFQPGETATPGANLVVVSNLDELTLTVYVPEDRYGVIMLGQVYPVTVDSFPGQSFNGTVAYISDQAEFTPRNVQTTDSRKATVFAIKLDLDPTGGLLKPGMPADVHFQAGR